MVFSFTFNRASRCSRKCLERTFSLPQPSPLSTFHSLPQRASFSLRRSLSSPPHAGSASAAAVHSQSVTPSPNLPTSTYSFEVIQREISAISEWIQNLTNTDNTTLRNVARYYVSSGGKFLRPGLVFLMSQATSHGVITEYPEEYREMQRIMSVNVNPDDIIPDINPSIDSLFFTPIDEQLDPRISPFQRRLAYATEVLHTASLLHDDVVDSAETRRGVPSANAVFGNKLTVLTGDFLMGRAMDWMTRTRNQEVMNLMVHAIINLSNGEIIQLHNTIGDSPNPEWNDDVLKYYVHKSFLKTGSLISYSCRAAVLLGLKPNPEFADAAFTYGKNLGIAFQLIDDVLDYTVDQAALGKPSGADLQLGLATAPLLYAWKAHAELGPLVGRRFSRPGDVEKAYELVAKSGGVEQTRELARTYVDNALKAIQIFPESDAKAALIHAGEVSLLRQK